MNANITLTWSEMLQAGVCGISRQIASMRNGLADKYGADSENGWSLHIEGAAGEIAFARWSNRFWSASVNTFHLPDVGTVQVRTRSRHEYELIVREKDADSDVFVLVTGRSPAFAIRGWIGGREAKRTEWLRDHGGRSPAWFVPHVALRPIIPKQDIRLTA